MSGHSKWSQIKHKKGVTDIKRGKLFSKLIQAIAIAAKKNPNPDFNPQLRSVIEKAKANKLPLETIERAIKRASETKDHQSLEELTIEAYGPSGIALIIEVATDNKNRAIAEIKNILSEFGGRLIEPGGVRWAFEQITTEEGITWQAKFKQEIPQEGKEKLQNLIEELENHASVQRIFTNVQF